jgi:hypothetical protein
MLGKKLGVANGKTKNETAMTVARSDNIFSKHLP